MMLNSCFNGLTSVNIELTSRCNKACFMCGRRKLERDYPDTEWGDMDFSLVQMIADQLPDGIVVQFHDNGEPLLYPRFGEAVALFKNQIKCVDTNGKLLIEKADEIIDNLDTITISTFEDDPEALDQYRIVNSFLRLKGMKPPLVVIRRLGNALYGRQYRELGLLIANRTFHSPEGSFQYKKSPTIPETGICLDLLNHMSIKRNGDVSICIRFDPEGKGIIGNTLQTPLSQIWGGEKRRRYIDAHLAGLRSLMPLCDKCEYYGVPTG